MKLEGSGMVDQGQPGMKNAPEGAAPAPGQHGLRKGDERVEIF